jgi:hypothetical protein
MASQSNMISEITNDTSDLGKDIDNLLDHMSSKDNPTLERRLT